MVRQVIVLAASRACQGLVMIRYPAEHLRIVSVFGPNVLDVSLLFGHIHTVDEAA
jgi:hypothetical protein